MCHTVLGPLGHATAPTSSLDVLAARCNALSGKLWWRHCDSPRKVGAQLRHDLLTQASAGLLAYPICYLNNFGLSVSK